MDKQKKEKHIEHLIKVFAFSSIIIVFLIFLFLFIEAGPTLTRIGLQDFLFSKSWRPTSSPERFGIISLIFGTIMVTIGAIMFAVPLSLFCAIYISEFAGENTKSIIKPTIEVLAGIPSVVYGFFGLVIIVPIVKATFVISTGETALTGAFLLAIMALPTITTVAEDALNSVPKHYREAALALGATEVETAFTVVLPAASSGIAAAVILGIGRAIGETMTVLMVTGGSAIIPSPFYNVLSPVRTMTATLAAEMGETVVGSSHYTALFGVGVVLFVITFVVNMIATYFAKTMRCD